MAFKHHLVFVGVQQHALVRQRAAHLGIAG